MTVHLANGGTVTVTESGTVEYRRGRDTQWIPGRGSRADSIAWVEKHSRTFGSAVLYITRNG